MNEKTMSGDRGLARPQAAAAENESAAIGSKAVIPSAPANPLLAAGVVEQPSTPRLPHQQGRATRPRLPHPPTRRQAKRRRSQPGP